MEKERKMVIEKTENGFKLILGDDEVLTICPNQGLIRSDAVMLDGKPYPSSVSYLYKELFVRRVL